MVVYELLTDLRAQPCPALAQPDAPVPSARKSQSKTTSESSAENPGILAKIVAKFDILIHL